MVSRTLRVVHEIRYAFSEERPRVTGLVRLRPLDGSRQRVLHHQLTSTPPEAVQLVGEDALGNEVTEVHWERVSEVTLRAVTAVELTVFGSRIAPADLTPFQEPTPLIPISSELRALGRSIFRGRPVDASSLFDFSRAMRATLAFDRGWAQVRRTATSALRHREGAASDYAQVALGVLRSLGHAACFVHGYLLPPVGAGEAHEHAWVALHTERRGWLELDPLLGCPPDLRHLAVAIGRDRDDVRPVESASLHRGVRRVTSRLAFYPLTRTSIPSPPLGCAPLPTSPRSSLLAP